MREKTKLVRVKESDLERLKELRYGSETLSEVISRVLVLAKYLPTERQRKEYFSTLNIQSDEEGPCKLD